MSALAKLRSQVPAVIAEYFALQKNADAKRERETKAAVKIQAHARGFLIRLRIRRFTRNAVTLQRFWRGYLGRLRAKLAKDEHDKKLRKAYFDAHATVIQRWFRGFWSRKHMHSFYARKAYLQAILEKNGEVRADLSKEQTRMVKLQQSLAEQAAKTMFESKIGRLHHLVSTQAQAGIFNSPYGAAMGTLPIIAGAPVEEHLKASMKTRIKSSKLPPLKGSSRGADNGVSGVMSFQTPMGAPLSNNPRHTLRQSVIYDAVHQADEFERKLYKAQLLLHHPEPFLTTMVHQDPSMNVQSNRNCEIYRTLFDPTVGIKNERFSARQQRISRSPFQKYIQKQPFFEKNFTEAY